MIKIAHIADVHLRDRQYGYRSRGADFSTALHNAVNKSIENGASAIICAGDLFDASHPSAHVVAGELKFIHQHLLEQRIPMFVTSGNHDLSEVAWSCVYEGDPERGGICDIDWKEVTVGGVTIKGLPFMSPENLRREIELMNRRNERYDIIVWHGEIAEFLGYPNPDAISMKDFTGGICKLVAMGDQHVHRYMSEEIDGHKVIVAYPGSTEMCSESEVAEKSLFMYTFADNREIADIETIPFETRPVQRFVIKTDLDLEDAVTKVVPGSLIFLKYNRHLSNVLPRLNAVLTPDNIVRPSLLPDDTERVDTSAVEMEHMITAGQYLMENFDKFIPEEEADDAIKTLCAAMLDSTADHRYAIDKFCSDQMEGKIIL